MDVTLNVGRRLSATLYPISVEPNQPVAFQPNNEGSINFLAEQGLNSRMRLVEIDTLMYKTMTHYSGRSPFGPNYWNLLGEAFCEEPFWP